MANTTTDSLDDSLDTVVASARIVREFEGVMPQLVDKVELEEGTGLSWKEVSFRQLSAQAVTELTELDNPQTLVDDDLIGTPTVVGIQTLITHRVAARLSKKAYAKTGQLAQNAIQRKKDEDGLTVLDGGTSLAGAGVTLTSGHIAAGAVRITSNATEPGMGPIRTVLHGFQIKDLYDELTASVGTTEVSAGETARVFREGFRGSVAGTMVYEDGNITIDGSDDAKGGTFAKMGIVLVQGRNLRRLTREEPHIGGGATSVFIYDEYVYVERLAGGTTSNFVFELYSDATAPTS